DYWSVLVDVSAPPCEHAYDGQAAHFHLAWHSYGSPNPLIESPLVSTGPPPGNPKGKDGDPVDLSTGLFVLDKTDLVLPDVLPITFTRTYRSQDSTSHAFGIGATHVYDLYLQHDALCSVVQLILPDGGGIRYTRVSGTNCSDSTLEHTATPTRFFKSTLAWDTTRNLWGLRVKDGMTYRFTASGAGLSEIQDRYGNLLSVARDASLRITQITSPHGRSITS